MKSEDLIGYWKITKMEVWGQAYVDLVLPGYIEFEMEGDHMMGRGSSSRTPTSRCQLIGAGCPIPSTLEKQIFTQPVALRCNGGTDANPGVRDHKGNRIVARIPVASVAQLVHSSTVFAASIERGTVRLNKPFRARW
jgi:hypothetical protein